MRTDFLLVRHGQVEAEWREKIYGCLDVPLSERGREEARRAADFLAAEPIDAVISSGLSRTRYGAAWLARARRLEVRHDAALREIDRGEWAGLRFDELEQQQPGVFGAWKKAPWTVRPPGGESMTDLAARVRPVLDDLAREFRGGLVAVVAHSHVLRAAVASAVGPEAAMELEVPTGSIYALDWTVAGPVQLSWAETFAAAR